MKNFIKDLIKNFRKTEITLNDYANNTNNLSNPALSYVEWAMKLMDEGKEDFAIEKLETATGMAIKNPEAYVNLSMTYLKKGQIENVPSLLKKAISIDSQYARAYMTYGIYYTTLKDYNSAEKYYKIAARLEPRLPDVFVNWAVSLVSQGKQQEAQEKFQKALFYNPRNIVGLYLWAILDIEMEKYKAAKEKLAAVLSFQPQNADALFYMAFIYYKEKNYISSIDFSKSALELNKENPQIYGLLADSYALSEQYDKACKVYEEADKKHFKNEKLYNSWGHNAYSNHDFEKSVYAYKNLLRINKDSVDAKYGLAMNFMIKENYDDAKTMLLEILEAQPDNTNALINLSKIEDIANNYSQSINYLEKAIKLDVKNACFYYDLGLKYEKAGDLEKAKSSYLKMIEYKTDNPYVYYHYANLLLEENPKEALRKIRKAYSSEPENENFVEVYAQAFFNNEQYKNSIDTINKFYKDDVFNSKMFYLKIESLLKLNNYEEVIKSLYGLNQEKKDNENFDYYLLWAYKQRAKNTNIQNDVNEMNDFSYYLSQKYSQNDNFMVKLNELDNKLY